ncbi:MAG: hypothetical protein J2P54_00905 [Bradyrhizobiaceae bacterium]|nr:hypothetical protein [Bradyrhizobiaceae bacterium]
MTSEVIDRYRPAEIVSLGSKEGMLPALSWRSGHLPGTTTKESVMEGEVF